LTLEKSDWKEFSILSCTSSGIALLEWPPDDWPFFIWTDSSSSPSFLNWRAGAARVVPPSVEFSAEDREAEFFFSSGLLILSWYHYWGALVKLTDLSVNMQIKIFIFTEENNEKIRIIGF
jgi:hypothetical protein